MTGQSIRITSEQMRMMSLFQKVTRVEAKDCIEEENQVIFVINEGKMGKAIGRGGATIKSLQHTIKKHVDLVEYREDPVDFIRGLLDKRSIQDVAMSERDDGSRQVVVTTEPGKKGLVVGREGRNAKKARLLAKRYFDISHISFNSPDRVAMLEL